MASVTLTVTIDYDNHLTSAKDVRTVVEDLIINDIQQGIQGFLSEHGVRKVDIGLVEIA